MRVRFRMQLAWASTTLAAVVLVAVGVHDSWFWAALGLATCTVAFAMRDEDT